MPRILSFTGKSGSGKTTLLEKLIPELTKRGHTVAVIKHTAHDVELDAQGKDTHRLRAAGAAAAAISSKNLLAVFQTLDGGVSAEEIADQYFTLPDLILTEGYKSGDAPQILVLPQGAPAPPKKLPANLLAIVADKNLVTGADKKPKAPIPCFSREDIAPIADCVEKNLLKPVSRSEVRLWVDGKFIPLNPFVKAFVGQTVKGMVSALRGGKGAEKIHVKIGK